MIIQRELGSCFTGGSHVESYHVGGGWWAVAVAVAVAVVVAVAVWLFANPSIDP